MVDSMWLVIVVDRSVQTTRSRLATPEMRYLERSYSLVDSRYDRDVATNQLSSAKLAGLVVFEKRAKRQSEETKGSRYTTLLTARAMRLCESAVLVGNASTCRQVDMRR